MSNRTSIARSVIGFVATIALTGSVASVASAAQRNVPKKANKYQATLVQGVASCLAPNTTESGVLAVPACDPPVPSDPVCVFTDKGHGKILFKAKDDIAVQVKVSGLDATCNGQTLCVVGGLRWTQDNCASTGSCTTITDPNLALGPSCCVVDRGKCRIKTTFADSFPGVLAFGNQTELIIGEVGLARSGGGGALAFKAGLLLP